MPLAFGVRPDACKGRGRLSLTSGERPQPWGRARQNDRGIASGQLCCYLYQGC